MQYKQARISNNTLVVTYWTDFFLAWCQISFSLHQCAHPCCKVLDNETWWGCDHPLLFDKTFMRRVSTSPRTLSHSQHPSWRGENLMERTHAAVWGADISMVTYLNLITLPPDTAIATVPTAGCAREPHRQRRDMPMTPVYADYLGSGLLLLLCEHLTGLLSTGWRQDNSDWRNCFQD